jgi:copper transport protein
MSGAFAVLALLLVPVALWAHTRLTRSDPYDGAALVRAPSEITLEFSEPAQLAMTSVKLASGADTTELFPLSVHPSNSRIVIAPIAGMLSDGRYTVLWRLFGRDGHPIRGAVSFSIASTGSAPTLTPGAAVTQGEDENSSMSMAVGGAIGFILVRWFAFVSLFLLVGAVTFKRYIIGPPGDGSQTFSHIASDNAATLGLVAAIGVVLTSLLRLARESSDMPDVAVTTMLFESTWGLSVFAQMIAGLIAAAGFRAAHTANGNSRRTGWHIALFAAVVAAAAPAFGGHAITGDYPALGVAADILHVLVGSAWLGTLAVIVIVGIPAALKSPDDVRPGARTAAMVNRFSPLALMCGGAVVATGVGSAVLRLPTIDTLWTTPYGVALLLKLLFVGFLFGAGAWNWRRMRPRLTGDDAIAPLRSSASFELVLAGVVLVITAVLVALALP